jgi:hypothetical protein
MIFEYPILLQKFRIFTLISFFKTLYFFSPRFLTPSRVAPPRGARVALAGLSSQNPGVQQVGSALFGSNPPVSDVVLEKTFGINEKSVQYIRNNFKA